MIYLGNDTMDKVERMVCEQVNTAMSTEEKEGVNADDLYVGNTNIPFARAVARNFVLDAMVFPMPLLHSARTSMRNLLCDVSASVTNLSGTIKPMRMLTL